MPLRSVEQFIAEGSKVFHRQAPNREAARGWLRIAARLIRDSRNSKNSNETRLTAAYDAILNFGLVVVSAGGYRVTSAEGHHAQTLEAACARIGASTGLSDRIDAVRVVRNEKYAGIEVKDADVLAAAKALDEFSSLCADWLKKIHKGFP
jgi:hypothetical protein